MALNNVLYNSAKIACLGKIWFFSYGLKSSQWTSLSILLSKIISARNQSIPFWLAMACCTSCQIRWQDSLVINISEENQSIFFFFFAWRYSSREGSIWDYHFWLGVARCASFPIRLCYSWSRMSLQGINSCQSINIWGYHFWWDIARCASCRIRCRII